MQKIISFNKSGYDPFLDFIKAFAILSVLCGHTFPYLDETGYFLWYGMQVPLFILIQVFHVLKRRTSRINATRIFNRVFLPFLIVQAGSLFINIIHGDSTNVLIHKYLIGGGVGPGSYYPWIYLQMAIILPLLNPIFCKLSKWQLAVVFIVICEGFEILSSLINLPDSLHRLLAFRYFFLIYLGWLWVKDGIVLNAKTIILSIISMGTIVFFEYYYVPIEPWFYDTVWRTHRWPCYFYVSTLLCGILYLLYDNTKKSNIIVKITKLLAKCSYEIFLLQMIAIPFLPQLGFIRNELFRFGTRTLIIWIFSIVGGYFFNCSLQKLLKTINNNGF